MPPDDGHYAGDARWSLISHYEAIAAASRRMLEAARADDWARVACEEDRCRTLISGLKRAHAAGALRLEQRQRLHLLSTMLADDAEIRERSEPWLRQLDNLLAGRAAGPSR